MLSKVLIGIAIVFGIIILIKFITMPRESDEIGLAGTLRRIKRACCSFGM